MQRRKFIERASIGAASGAALAAPAVKGAEAAVRWRMASSFPKSLDTLFGPAELMVKTIAAMTENRFQISTHQAGEIVPGLQVLDAVQNGTVECGQTALYYFYGKDPAYSFPSSVPFGFNTRQYNAWWYQGGGKDVVNQFTQKSGVQAVLAGNTTAQMGGWFRKEITKVEDLNGLKIRIAGLAGEVLSRLGAVPQQLAGGDIYPALEKGAIDATEFVGPYDDEKLGFHKVAKFYYYPSWFEGCTAIHALVGKKAWESLSPANQAAFEAGAAVAYLSTTSRYDAQNPAALKRLVAGGTQLKAFSRPIMDACYRVAHELYAEISAKNAEFKKLHDSYFSFQKDQIDWFRVAENSFDDYMASVKR